MGNIIRIVSVRVFYNLFDKIGIKPNVLTVLNFLINSMSAVVLFAVGMTRIAILFCIMGGMIDCIDGTLARDKFGGNTELGQWLDTSLDWLYYLLLIGGIAYGCNQLVLGLICLIATVFANYIDTQKPTVKLHSWFFSPVFFIVTCSVLNQMDICLYLMTFFALLRTLILWAYSIRGER